MTLKLGFAPEITCAQIDSQAARQPLSVATQAGATQASATQDDVLNYVQQLIPELKSLTQSAGLVTLAGILELAGREANLRQRELG